MWTDYQKGKEEGLSRKEIKQKYELREGQIKLVERYERLKEEYDLDDYLKNVMKIEEWCKEKFEGKPEYSRRTPNREADDPREKTLGSALRHFKKKPIWINYQKGKNEGLSREEIIRMYARGMSNQKIYEEMQELYGVKVSLDMVTAITDKIIPEIREWQKRQLEEQYAIVFVDATYFNVKQDGIVVKKAVYIALGVTMTGEKEILGFYIGESESAKYWTSILNEIKNRGVKDILIMCSDGLKGLKEAIGAVYPMTEFQRCIVHMIRNTLQYVSYKDRKELAQDLKQIY